MNVLANDIIFLALSNGSINMFNGCNFEYFENFEPQSFSGLRLPPYLRWVDCWLVENNYSQDDLQQIQIALSNNWELVEDQTMEDNDRWFPYLRAEDPNEDEGHLWLEHGFETSHDHQESIDNLVERRFPAQCLCNMCVWGRRNIQTHSMLRFLTAHQEAYSLLRNSMPCKLKLKPYLK